MKAATRGLTAVRRTAGIRRNRKILWYLEVGLLLTFLVLPAVVSEFQVAFATRVLLLAMLALSLDLTWGFGGIVTIGQAAFFGAGAYTAGLLATHEGVTSLLVAIPIAVVVAVVAGAALGAFLFAGRRRVGFVYVALATLVASFALEQLAGTWSAVGAANGIPSVPLPEVAGFELRSGSASFYFLVLGTVVAVYLALRFLVRSQFGLVLAASRDDLERVSFLGYRTPRMQVLIFTVAAGIAGLAGGLFAFHEGFVSPSVLGIGLSTQAIIWVLFGGRGTLVGAVVGVVAIEFAGQTLSERFPELWQIGLGAILLLGILYLRDGVVGLIASESARTLRFGASGAPTVGAQGSSRTATVAARAARRGRPEPSPRALGAPILSATGIEKSYGELRALDGADLVVAPGEIHGVIGPNGSGKTTLLHTISGAVMADAGTVLLEGRPMTRWSSCDRACAGLSLKFQIPRIFPALSLFDNVLLALQARHSQRSLIRSRSRSDCSAQVLAALDKFNLAERSDQLAGRLSHGEQQWLEIAMALAVSPCVLLLDEPTAGMSPEERRATGEILSRVSDCSIVMVEHDLAFISSVCHQVTVLDQGRVVACGSVEDIRRNATVREAFVGHV